MYLKQIIMSFGKFNKKKYYELFINFIILTKNHLN